MEYERGERPASAAAASPEAGDGRTVRYHSGLREAVLALQRLAYPARRRAWIDARWDWMFLQSADRVGVPPAVWVHADDTGAHAQRGAVMVRLQVGPATLVAGWLVDTVVLPHLRGRGIGEMLVKRATDDLPVGLSLGQTEQIRALQDRHGWRAVVSMRSWFVVLEPGEAFRGRVANPVARAAVAWSASAWRWACRAMAGHVSRREVRHVQHFDEAHDRLWERVRTRFRCLVVRDASYLNWKYVSQPGTSPRRLSIVDAGGEVGGVCVWTLHRPSRSHAYTRGWILDLIVDPDAAEDVRALFEAVIADARAQGVAVLEFDMLAPALVPCLRKAGWIRGGVTRHLRAAVHDVAPDLAASMADPGAWFLSRGDSDGDHPWWTPDGREPETPTA